ncbi:MAG: fructose-6-phosphate aldolase [Acholeplasmatales bacterium]|nr:MAG: fructose-6-phosphate aldolase [Acholeplasmatales bacterium]
MKLYIDTANVAHIKEIAALGILSGVTTNPTLIAKEGRDFKTVIAEITELVDGPISGEVIALDAEGMVREGRDIAAIHPNLVVKIPMTPAGLQAVHVLSQENIKTNVTLVFSASQALFAAKAGATYVSPFIGRLDDAGQDGVQLVADIRMILDQYDLPTEIISASIRHPQHIAQSALAGAHIATIPYAVFQKAFKHPLTDQGIEAFLTDWKNVFGA